MTPPDTASFLWVPGQGPDEAALGRMMSAFPKPRTPMGEAWFLASERKMYPELLGEIETLADDQLTDAVRETIGPSCFGPRAEWTDWYHYLMPRLLQRRWSQPLIWDPVELIISAFVAQHPDTYGPLPYPAFANDALMTLGRVIMEPRRWPGGKLHLNNCLNKSRLPDGTFAWHDAGGLLSASLFFCLKYLAPAQVGPWLQSVIAIPNPYWKAQVVIWLVGAHPLLTGDIDQPGQLFEKTPNIDWDSSHSLDGHYDGNFDLPIVRTPFLPESNRFHALKTICDADLEDFLLEWQTSPELADLAAETAGLPDRFRALDWVRTVAI